MKKFFEIIKNSLTSPGGKESSTRIGAYVLLGLIILFTIIFLVIEAINALDGGTISNEAIIIFGMLMTHHLVLLGINKHHETKEKIANVNNLENK